MQHKITNEFQQLKKSQEALKKALERRQSEIDLILQELQFEESAEVAPVELSSSELNELVTDIKSGDASGYEEVLMKSLMSQTVVVSTSHPNAP